MVCEICGKEVNLDPTEPTDHDGLECPQCAGIYCYGCGGWKVVDGEDVCKDCAEKAGRSEMIKLTPIGIDGWDRVVFNGDNGRLYKTTELVPRKGFLAATEEERLGLLRSLCTTDKFDGEPDFPCWKEGAFSIDWFGFNR